MAVDFEIPSDGLDDYGNPITFEFSGDDDMWVFIDDNLVLDVGGIHQPVTGSINFSADKVSVYGVKDTTITQRFLDANSPIAWETGDGKSHTMKIFYLERGGCDSNLSVKFNTPLHFGKGKLSLVKREKNTTTPLKGAKFGIWDNQKCQGDPIAEYTTKDDGTIDFGEFVLKSGTDTFFLKEVEGPNGYIKDPIVYQIKPRLNGQGDVVKDSSGEYVILDVCAADGSALTMLENGAVVFPNTKVGKIDIPAKKTWECAIQNDATVTMTIKRFKLIDQTKGFMIIKELWGEPDGSTFDATYRITYPDGTIKDVDYNQFSNGVYGIENAVPGNYLIEETVKSSAPDGYHMTHTMQSISVTLEEDGTAVANFKTTFERDKGKLYIKENVTVQNGSSSDIDYSGVKYVVLDANGRKVTSVTHAQATSGIELDLPTGTYSVKAVGIPETPVQYNRTEQYVSCDNPNLTQQGTVFNNINVTSNNRTQVNFYTEYVKLNNAQNCTWIIKDQYHQNGQQYKSGVVSYPVGTKLRMSFQVPQDQAYANQFDVSYGGVNLTGAMSNVQSNYEYSVEFTVQDNAQLVFRFNANSQANPKKANVTDPKFEIIEHAPQASTTSFNRTRLAAKHGESSALDLRASNPAKHPEAPAGKKYVKDSVWSETIELNSGNNWQDTLKQLPASDDEGNKYYYYVDSVQESGLLPGTSCDIKLAGEDILLIGQDLNNDKTLEVTNKLTGSLNITKNIQTNGVIDTAKTGTFYYAVYSEAYDPDAATHADPIRTGSITVSSEGTSTVEVTELAYGTYFVYELTGEGGTPIVSGSEGVRKSIANTVYLVTGSGTAAVVDEDTPTVTLTNNKETVNVEVEKDWQDNNNAKGKRPSELKVTLSNGTEVILNSGNNWKATIQGLPKYNAEGQSIVYTWTEETIGNGYTLIGTNIDSVTGADGTETQTTTLTNGPDEHYNPKTTFTGTKTWNDDGTIRPDEIVVILYKGEGAQKQEVERKTLTKKEDGSNAWTYEFSNIPVFDEQGNVINYSVDEVLPNGYTCSLGESSAPGYERDTANDQVFVNEPNADVRVSTGVNLGFVVIKHGNDFIIWTPRKATEAELTEIKNKVAAKRNAIGDQEFSQILSRPHTNVYGVPCYDIKKGNMQASVYMDGDEVVVHFGNKNWSQLAWGQLAYTYTPGRADLINTQNITSLKFYKKWIDSAGMESEWDKDIEVTVKRNGDDNFSLVYKLAKTDIVNGNLNP